MPRKQRPGRPEDYCDHARLLASRIASSLYPLSGEEFYEDFPLVFYKGEADLIVGALRLLEEDEIRRNDADRARSRASERAQRFRDNNPEAKS